MEVLTSLLCPKPNCPYSSLKIKISPLSLPKVTQSYATYATYILLYE